MTPSTEFLERYLDDIEKVELVFYLWKHQKPIGYDELSTNVRIPASVARDLITELTKTNVLEVIGGEIRLGARAGEQGFTDLMRDYDADRFAVISTLSRMAMERMRAMAARAFANAFVFRKNTKPGGGDG